MSVFSLKTLNKVDPEVHAIHPQHDVNLHQRGTNQQEESTTTQFLTQIIFIEMVREATHKQTRCLYILARATKK